MSQLLDLTITFTQPPDSPSDSLAHLALRCEELGLVASDTLFHDPLTPLERTALRWYLEEYWRWPYLEFAERGRQVEALLADVGKRLYNTVFGNQGGDRLMQAWQARQEEQRQISIESDIPQVLSLPWELLHDAQGFLALRAPQPVPIIRRLPHRELAQLSAPFEPPLRVLLVTARPKGTGFVDPRGIARELVDELDEQVRAGTVALEVLRPPSVAALRSRLRDRAHPPIHILHFDGHGMFYDDVDERSRLAGRLSGSQQGVLAFEQEGGGLDLVGAADMAHVLQDSGVKLVVLNACQSAIGSADDAFSSVAAQLIRGGVDAVVAMSASILVDTAARYVKAFYHELAGGRAAPVAHEQARQALHRDLRRHRHRRRRDEEGRPIELVDWWLPHFYQQRPLELYPTTEVEQQPALPSVHLSESMPDEPRYGFSGRAYELLQIERWLMQDKLVLIHGFGGVGKTALACEAASWLTRSKMYDGACFVPFEHGGGATTLLSALDRFLGVYDRKYHQHDRQTDLVRLRSVLKRRRTLVIIDGLDSILPGGDVPVEPEERTQLWDMLMTLKEIGSGVLLTCRAPTFAEARQTPGEQVASLLLRGLHPDDAYEFASHLLDDLGIDRGRVAYTELRDLLAQLDYHPLALQLVLPALRALPLSSIRDEFEKLLLTFVDEATTGRNRSLLMSLEYSLRRLDPEQRALLPCLAIFEQGASEDDLLAITEIPEEEWTRLCAALAQTALLDLEHTPFFASSFIYFHPVLTPYLRGLPGAGDEERRKRYVQHYAGLANDLYQEDVRHPQAVRALIRRELPNLQRAVELLLDMGRWEEAAGMAERVRLFLMFFGLFRERDALRKKVGEAIAAATAQKYGGLTQAEWHYECGVGEDEWSRGALRAATIRFITLLERINALPAGVPCSAGSYEHALTLQWLARCLEATGQTDAAEEQLQKALSMIRSLIEQDPGHHGLLSQLASLLTSLGDVQRAQGHYEQARSAYEEGLKIDEHLRDLRGQAVVQGQLGTLALLQKEVTTARRYYASALKIFQDLDEPPMEAVAWYQLGMTAQEQKAWEEAEQYYRNSLEIMELLGDERGVAETCSQLATVVEEAGRPGEAEGWYKRALDLDQRVYPGSLSHAAHLNNLADLLTREVQAKRLPTARLGEARGYAEQALAIKEKLDASAAIWATFGILAAIADLVGQAEVAQRYARRERESFAGFAGNRSFIDQRFGPLIAAIAAAARGDLYAQEQVQAALPKLEARGWRVAEASQRIWAGERDWHALTESLDRRSALLVQRVLDRLTKADETQEDIPEHLIALLPTTIQTLLDRDDVIAFRATTLTFH